jgi:hypothetical protein
MNLDLKITRRKFMKLAAVIGSAIVIGISGKTILDERKQTKELARRSKKLSTEGGRWFSQNESILLGTLAALIVPSDEKGPGASDANVNDYLDRLVATKKGHQEVYSNGLYDFDKLAKKKYGQMFADLTPGQGIELLELVDRAAKDINVRVDSLSKRIYRKLKYYEYAKWDGLGTTIDLFPILVKDVMGAYYTSQVSWDWLGYEGPPQPRGYILGRVSACQVN